MFRLTTGPGRFLKLGCLLLLLTTSRCCVVPTRDFTPSVSAFAEKLALQYPELPPFNDTLQYYPALGDGLLLVRWKPPMQVVLRQQYVSAAGFVAGFEDHYWYFEWDMDGTIRLVGEYRWSKEHDFEYGRPRWGIPMPRSIADRKFTHVSELHTWADVHEWWIRAWALRELLKIYKTDPERASSIAIQGLGDPSGKVRETACQVLTALLDKGVSLSDLKEVRGIVRKLLFDESYSVRGEVGEMLERHPFLADPMDVCKAILHQLERYRAGERSMPTDSYAINPEDAHSDDVDTLIISLSAFKDRNVVDFLGELLLSHAESFDRSVAGGIYSCAASTGFAILGKEYYREFPKRDHFNRDFRQRIVQKWQEK